MGEELGCVLLLELLDDVGGVAWCGECQRLPGLAVRVEVVGYLGVVPSGNVEQLSR